MSELRVPTFLRKDFKPDDIELIITDLLDKYAEHFGEKIICDPGTVFSEDEWIKILKTCIKENKTFEEITGIDDSYMNYDECDI